jgi:hypothetical protein
MGEQQSGISKIKNTNYPSASPSNNKGIPGSFGASTTKKTSSFLVTSPPNKTGIDSGLLSTDNIFIAGCMSIKYSSS